VSYRDRGKPSLGLSSPRAPWRRVARPLAILFSLQLSGIGCAARAPELPAPSRPDEVAPYLGVYERQLESAGMSREAAEDYLEGRADSPLPVSNDADDPVPADDVLLPAPSQASEPTFKVVDGVAEYRIGAGDLLLVTTFLGPEQAQPRTLRVQADGSIFIARFDIGTIQAAGLTPTELTRALTAAYQQYVPGGYVEARVEEYNAWMATLTGQIRRINADGPGTYPLEGRVTVSNFIYSHGGPDEQADLGDVRILREGVQERVDVAAVLSGAIADPPLFAGDIVYVPSIEQGSSRMFIFGEVRNSGVYTYTEGISVLDAIAQAGGYTPTAKRDAVYISRPSSREVIPVNLDVTLGAGEPAPRLEPGDFVVVPYSPDRSQLIRDWVGIFSVVLSALTIIELVRRD
jgi:polysaccharide export outer membrane protein